MRSKEAQFQTNAPKLFRQCITMQTDHNPNLRAKNRVGHLTSAQHAFHLLRPKVNSKPQRRKHVMMSTGAGLQGYLSLSTNEKGGLFIKFGMNKVCPFN